MAGRFQSMKFSEIEDVHVIYNTTPQPNYPTYKRVPNIHEDLFVLKVLLWALPHQKIKPKLK
jgi:hypothetical protein